jgi:hypothetical protein
LDLEAPPMKSSAVIIFVTLLMCALGNAADPRPLTEFFPAGVFGRGNADMDAAIAWWYATQFRAFKEPSIQTSAEPRAEIYRFTLLPTFNTPLMVRLTVAADGSGVAIAKRLSGEGGYNPGKIDFERTLKVTQKQVEALRATLAAQKFWQMPTAPERTGSDGMEYVFEGLRDNVYHVVTRWTPAAGDGYRALCVELLHLGQLEEVPGRAEPR